MTDLARPSPQPPNTGRQQQTVGSCPQVGGPVTQGWSSSVHPRHPRVPCYSGHTGQDPKHQPECVPHAMGRGLHLLDPVPLLAQVPESAPSASHSQPAGIWGQARPTCSPGQPAPADIPQGGLPLNDSPASLQGRCQALPHGEALTCQLDAGLEEASPGQPPMSLVRQLIATDLARNCHRQPPCKGRGTQLVVPDQGHQGLS